MIFWKFILKLFSKLLLRIGLIALLINSFGCAGQSKKIALGMLSGAFVGAAVGHQFVHHGEYKQYETQNTIISSIVFSLATGGILAWHYNSLKEQQIKISGRYTRYRLCDPKEMDSDLIKQLNLGGDKMNINPLQKNQIQKLAIYLDDSTKWAYPVFRKRYLVPERGEKHVLSKRYIWEIIKPGSFVTRFQNPQYFFEGESK